MILFKKFECWTSFFEPVQTKLEWNNLVIYKIEEKWEKNGNYSYCWKNQRRINFIDFQSTACGKQKWLMEYQDYLPKYCFLFSLKCKKAGKVGSTRTVQNIHCFWGTMYSETWEMAENSLLKLLKNSQVYDYNVYGRPVCRICCAAWKYATITTSMFTCMHIAV